ncbi:MAG: (deoxy)nucleoside triphosphate pyrophosphohydrolase [Lachnospiraceae bacterium]|nr:(deoxy)nucleoside triphosphate pyrophosphohydrolase [Lachnospiraceae bacterium]
MKTVKVVAAVIRKKDAQGRDLIFATQRGYGEFKDGWEFPGGKVEPGESPAEALKREILEELDAQIEVGDLIQTVEYDYPAFHLSMDVFWCTLISDELKLKEAEAARWLAPSELRDVAWLPADLELIEHIAACIQETDTARAFD